VGSRPAGYPPLGINTCELLWISVDNVGTTQSRSDVDNLALSVRADGGAPTNRPTAKPDGYTQPVGKGMENP
jgi:hypothetical protein